MTDNPCRLFEPTLEQEADWATWVETRPAAVREVARRFNPWTLYRLKGGGHRVTLVSFGEEEGGGVSLRVNVSGEFNLLSFERQVFGISPDDLEPCELPGPGEPVGAALVDDASIRAMCDALRMTEDAVTEAAGDTE